MRIERKRYIRLGILTTVGLFAFTLLLSYWGWSRVHEFTTSSASPDDAAVIVHHFLGRIYLSLQLFVLHPQGLPRKYPWQLNVARFLAPAFLAVTTLSLLASAFMPFARRLLIVWSPRKHDVVCGAGVHGRALVEMLARRKTPLVVIDIDPQAPGMRSQIRCNQSRLHANAVERGTLQRAGVTRAARLIAVTGNDVVNAQIASAVRELCRGTRRKPAVFAQIEDRTVAHFLEDGEASRGLEGAEASAKAPTDAKHEEISIQTFGANALAAEALFGGGVNPNVDDPQMPLVDLETTDYVLLAGDHGIIEATVVAALRRLQAEGLREAAEAKQRPLRITLIGGDAQRYRDQIASRWYIDPRLIALDAADLDPRDEAAVLAAPISKDWQEEVTHALVACHDEHTSIATTIALSRVLGQTVRLARVSTQPKNALDGALGSHPGRETEIKVLPIVELAWGKPIEVKRSGWLRRGAVRLPRKALMEARPSERLTAALRNEGFAGDVSKVAERILDRKALPQLRLRSDAAPRITPATAPIVNALLKSRSGDGGRSARASTLVMAGLMPELRSPEIRKHAAELLTREANRAAFTAWCEYARLLDLKDLDSMARDLPVAVGLKAATLGMEEALDGLPADAAIVATLQKLGPQRITIIAGGATSMERAEQERIREMLTTALRRYDGVVLTGGNEVGVCGAVRAAARLRNIPVIGYAPAGKGKDGILLRATASGDFSECEPVAMWSDILTAARGRHLHSAAPRVRVVAFPGGAITSAEIVLARALGAEVASLDPCGHLDAPLADMLPFDAHGVYTLPADAMTLRAFLMRPTEPLPAEFPMEAVARALHDQYRRKHQRLKPTGDPALAPWDLLTPALKNSNLAAVEDIPNKLHSLDKRLDPEGKRLWLSEGEVDLLAEMEHGRYNCERLIAGWKLDRTRAPSRHVSPYLVPWQDLDETVKQWDRDAVLAIDAALQTAGWGVAPNLTPDGSHTPRPVEHARPASH